VVVLMAVLLTRRVVSCWSFTLPRVKKPRSWPGIRSLRRLGRFVCLAAPAFPRQAAEDRPAVDGLACACRAASACRRRSGWV